MPNKNKAEVRRLLFVCTGSTCRSPLARFLTERLAREAGLPWTAAAAGISAVAGAPLSPGTIRALAARSITGVHHAARRLDESMLRDADVAYALAHGHREAMLSQFPAYADKIFVLREAAGLVPHDVDDPIGGSDAAYEKTASLIEEALKILIRRTPYAQDSR